MSENWFDAAKVTFFSQKWWLKQDISCSFRLVAHLSDRLWQSAIGCQLYIKRHPEDSPRMTLFFNIFTLFTLFTLYSFFFLFALSSFLFLCNQFVEQLAASLLQKVEDDLKPLAPFVVGVGDIVVARR